MPAIVSQLAAGSAVFEQNRTAMLEKIAQLRALEERTRSVSQAAQPLFDKRGQMLPRARIARLLDAGAPFLELSTLAGYLRDAADPDKTVPGGGVIAGIGYVAGVRAMILASDSGINAGALKTGGLEKMLRAQSIARDKKLPFIHLVESAGANLLEYRVENFVQGGGIFYNLARLSAAGVPVVTVVHGSSTAGGAYMPGLSDYVVMVKERSRAFLAGPPLLKAATGEIATEEELGGAEMHYGVSGLAEYLAQDDGDALRIAREIVAALGWNSEPPVSPLAYDAPRHDAEELLGLMPADPKKPVDMREVVARIVDGSDFLEFKAGHGSPTVTGHAAICGQRIGILSNNGPLDPEGANKATHFIQACCQAGTPLVFLQNTTGFIVGAASERAGMIKHGSKMIQAVSNANVPRITIHCGASFGAGNYGMCGTGFAPDFAFSWPNARTAVMGGEQAAGTMAEVMAAGAKRKGRIVDEAALDAMKQKITAAFDGQMSAFYTSGLMLDDGVIDPRDTRKVLALTLSVCAEAEQRILRPVQFGVARP
ncbi:MAG TPA: carboxyl transferase domain-containing protein [Burkholderiaceae bacterium]